MLLELKCKEEGPHSRIFNIFIFFLLILIIIATSLCSQLFIIEQETVSVKAALGFFTHCHQNECYPWEAWW